MNLTEIEKRAKTLMVEHGVGSLEFAFDNSRSRLGATHMRIFNRGLSSERHIPFKITLSKNYAMILPAEEIEEVILHEIAHALTPGHNHNAVWKAAARRIGAKPERCARPSASPERSVVGMCVPCNFKMSEGHRLPQRLYIHSRCGSPLVYFRNGQKVYLQEMPASYRERYSTAKSLGRI